MKRVGRQPTTSGPLERFTGDVWVDMISADSTEPPVATAGIVRFAPGARTAWHRHARGQTLHVLDGVAIVHSEDGTTLTAYPGETVHSPPGEWHWHGASADRFMAHLALSVSLPDDTGPAVTWGDHVSDDDYRQAASTATSERPSND